MAAGQESRDANANPGMVSNIRKDAKQDRDPGGWNRVRTIEKQAWSAGTGFNLNIKWAKLGQGSREVPQTVSSANIASLSGALDFPPSSMRRGTSLLAKRLSELDESEWRDLGEIIGPGKLHQGVVRKFGFLRPENGQILVRMLGFRGQNLPNLVRFLGFLRAKLILVPNFLQRLEAEKRRNQLGIRVNLALQRNLLDCVTDFGAVTVVVTCAIAHVDQDSPILMQVKQYFASGSRGWVKSRGEIWEARDATRQRISVQTGASIVLSFSLFGKFNGEHRKFNDSYRIKQRA
ncbi:hypothetical protein C8R47DRAFT_1083927 [Mycena vitilis]|nr:hypothetical protein C8R47DRAFT_1083927 [Mycena vitilis]